MSVEKLITVVILCILYAGDIAILIYSLKVRKKTTEMLDKALKEMKEWDEAKGIL